MSIHHARRLGVLTSGGDAPGMNAAVRAVVRTALNRGVKPYAIYEGFQGLVDGGERIREVDWEAASGILQLGGTVIGTARSKAFRSREGRLQAARHLLERSIDGLVVIGGDGSLTGAYRLQQEWPDLLAELVAGGLVTQALATRHAHLNVVGLVGSIDNDMLGTDLTIGADTALRRITDAVDAIRSTAASHQRTFIVEVMGRNCGYLALMSALATGASWVLLPEDPPEPGLWEDEMCRLLQAAREAGRRDSLIIVAEGARDRSGAAITSAYVKQVLEKRLDLDTRVTILGHVQRGGAPSAFDRYMGTVLGYAAVERILSDLRPTEETRFYGFALADALATRLARLPALVVRPPSAWLSISDPLVDPVEAGRRLLAERVLSGSYVRSEEGLTLNWQLLEVASKAVRSGGTITVPPTELATLQSAIADEVFAALRASGELEDPASPLSQGPRSEKVTAEVPAEVMEEYLEARALLNSFALRSGHHAEIEQARNTYEHVLEQAPHFAPAHAGLGLAYLRFVRNGFGGQDHLLAAQRHLERALELDPDLLEARLYRAYTLLRAMLGYWFFLQSVLDKAIATLEEVVTDDPNLQLAYPTLAMCYARAGQLEQATALITEETRDAAATDGEMAYRLATCWAELGDAEQALHGLRKAIYLGNENYPWFIRNPSWATLHENRDYREVLSDLKETYRLNRTRWERMPVALPV